MNDLPTSHRVPFDGSFILSEAPTQPPKDAPSDNKLKKQLKKLNEELYELQRVLYANHKFSILLIFQAMDAAGKDSTIRHVMSGVNPAGCQVFSFKQPSKEELKHDFLWRSVKRLPEKGRIGIFNRSYYEEVLVLRTHPEYLSAQNLPNLPPLDELWEQRYESIRDHEKHIARNGTVIIKFWLNISQKEQKNRFIERMDNPAKNWKFSSGDLKERSLWNEYMAAYQDALNNTSTPQAPWYAIPADNKPWMRVQVAKTIIQTLKTLPLSYPEASEKEVSLFKEMRQKLESEK